MVGGIVLSRLHRGRGKAAKYTFAVVSVCVALLAAGLTPELASGASPAVDVIMSIDDGGSPFVAVRGASTTGPSSGAWAVTVRNTGTVASSGTTQVEFNAAVNGNNFGSRAIRCSRCGLRSPTWTARRCGGRW